MYSRECILAMCIRTYKYVRTYVRMCPSRLGMKITSAQEVIAKVGLPRVRIRGELAKYARAHS